MLFRSLIKGKTCFCPKFQPSAPDRTQLGIVTQDNIYGYRVETTPTGAEAKCLYCEWGISLDLATRRQSFTACDRAAKQHSYEKHEGSTRA